MDVCCFSGKTFRYLGTYERVGDQGITTLTSEALEYLDHEVRVHWNGVAEIDIFAEIGPRLKMHNTVSGLGASLPDADD